MGKDIAEEEAERERERKKATAVLPSLHFSTWYISLSLLVVF